MPMVRDQGADDHLHRPESAPLDRQDAVGHDRRDDHADQQRHLEQQRQADRAAEELRQVGGHRRHLADSPHRQDHRRGELVAAHLGEVAPGDDPQLGRQRLEQHGDHVGQHDHPQQGVAVFRAGLDVGGEVAGVHVGDRGDHRRAGEQQRGTQPDAPATQRLADRQGRAVTHGLPARDVAHEFRPICLGCLMLPWLHSCQEAAL